VGYSTNGLSWSVSTNENTFLTGCNALGSKPAPRLYPPLS
jgi:hypothetical protein